MVAIKYIRENEANGRQPFDHNIAVDSFETSKSCAAEIDSKSHV